MIASTAYVSIQPTQRVAQGGAWVDAVALRQADGTAQDVTNYTLDFVAEVLDVAVAGGINKTNLAGGLFTISLTAAQTAGFTAPAAGIGQLWGTVAGSRSLLMTFTIVTIPEVKP